MKTSRSATRPCMGIVILFLAVFVLTTLPSQDALAVHSISYSNAVNLPIVVNDGDPDDMNPLADQIEVHFSLADGVNNDWVASGTILATTTTNPDYATLVVTGTTIQNVTGNQVIAAQILVDHDFDPVVSLTQDYSAHIDGSFDKVGGDTLGTLSLAFSATVTGQSLGGTFFMDGLVPAPVFFDWDGLPQHQDTIINQHQEFTFYMDELDNTINLFNSATILPTVLVGVEEKAWGGIKNLFR